MLEYPLHPTPPSNFKGKIMAKKKLKPTDGLGPLEVKKIRTAIRLVWQRSHPRKIVVKRCTDRNGWLFCEKCHKKTPALKVDHIVACGEVDGGFIERMFVPSQKLQGLCHPCHKIKTKNERSALRKKKTVYTDDFY